jgi:hypothetical protein
MKRLSVWLSVTLAALCNPVAAAHKPKLLVQFYGISIEHTTPTAVFYNAFLVLPDGTHALATCAEGPTTPCDIGLVPIEKRVKVPCDLVKAEDVKLYHPTCYQSERYEAERKNNDIALRTASGKVTYHITGSW